ncbi:glutaredoxin family protein [Sansalvadorimonas sp. 2012CJ34-2]|uniref:Glutaredoxin family protein n=1 Tax=Parendozoicomonas callyspongiae TaxID=2942213 RepID=A0ABT0PF65_9GAMM|nr:glutaredoxin family protein [Sansalvadorimonas sp. 2012CJ34-2]MCL6269851.1 glutaredoxin family protein [Sansalvadorimonas sp. 2012CJ34-2]
MQLFLMTTAGCHLCEQALEILNALQEQADFQLDLIDIATDDQLIDRYGIRIPVVVDGCSKKELGWPFTAQQLVDCFHFNCNRVEHA